MSHHRVRVPPRHCDAQGMLHASRPHEYAEDAFLAWLDDACGGYAAMREQGYDFVIVEARHSYLRPARLGDLLTVEVRPVSAGRTAFTVAFDISRDGATIVTLGGHRRNRAPLVHSGPVPDPGRPDRRVPPAPA